MNPELIKAINELLNEIDSVVDYDNPYFSSIGDHVTKVENIIKSIDN